MTKKLSFNDLPAAVEKILEIISSEESAYTALPELIQRMNVQEKKIDLLQRIVSPDLAVMDTQSVCRVLRLRPKAVKELSDSGVLPYRTEGRKTLYYEDGVVRYFMTQPAWSSAVSKPAAHAKSEAEKSETGVIEFGERQRIDINAACEILDRSAAAIYQLASNCRIPHYKEGRKIYFFNDELQKWMKANPPRKRKQK